MTYLFKHRQMSTLIPIHVIPLIYRWMRIIDFMSVSLFVFLSMNRIFWLDFDSLFFSGDMCSWTWPAYWWSGQGGLFKCRWYAAIRRQSEIRRRGEPESGARPARRLASLRLLRADGQRRYLLLPVRVERRHLWWVHVGRARCALVRDQRRQQRLGRVPG